MKFERAKRLLLTDSIVVVLIIVVAGGFLYLMSRKKVGWEIKDEQVVMTNEEKNVNENILIYDEGELKLENSKITMSPAFVGDLGIFVEGESILEMSSSSIESSEYEYFINARESDGISPQIILVDSTLSGHAGLYLNGRTTLDSTDSVVGTLKLADQAVATLRGSSVIPVLVSDVQELYTDLNSGEHLTKRFESNSGWVFDIEDTDVRYYEVELRSGNDIEIRDSQRIGLSLHTPGNLSAPYFLGLTTGAEPSYGSLTDLGFNLVWSNSSFEHVSLYSSGADDVSVTGTGIGDAVAVEQSRISLENLSIMCETCAAMDTSQISMKNVSVNVTDRFSPVLFVLGSSSVVIENSDIRGLKVVVFSGGTVRMLNSQYDEAKIEVQDGGTVSYE